MIYNGVVIRLNDLYLFLLDPDTFQIKDGINISEHECYKDMKPDQLMVVSVSFKDGTEDIDKVDLDEFIYGDTYGKYDTFIHIQDLALFTISNKEETITLEEIIQKGELSEVINDCFNKTFNIKNNKEDE